MRWRGSTTGPRVWELTETSSEMIIRVRIWLDCYRWYVSLLFHQEKKDMFHCIHVHSFEATDLSTPIYYVCEQTNNPKAFDYIHLACLFLNNSLERFIVWPKFTFNADSIAFGSLQLLVMKIIFCNCSICIQKEN